MKPIIKVDRVHSIDEAKQLESLGVDIIGVSISEDERFRDNRKISKQLALDIQKSLSSAKLCCQLSWNPELLDFLKDSNFDFIQLLEHKSKMFEVEQSQADLNQLTKELKMGIIYSGISITYDDDPSWILDDFENETDPNNYYFHIELLGTVSNSWSFLKEECPKYSDTLKISDVENLAKHYPILIGLNPLYEDIVDCIRTIPDIKGFSFSLADVEPVNNSIHWLNHLQLVKILEAMP
jgi:hypothetical protein